MEKGTGVVVVKEKIDRGIQVFYSVISSSLSGQDGEEVCGSKPASGSPWCRNGFLGRSGDGERKVVKCDNDHITLWCGERSKVV